MKNWMVELEKHLGSDDARLVVQLVAGAVVVATIIAGNWHLFIR
ncbi:MAG TPA: hypothetical protein VIN71_07615 [Pseudomonadales bacterium]